MIAKVFVLWVTIFPLVLTSFGQNENAVDVIPHWKQNDTYSVKIKSTTADLIKGQVRNFLSTFDARFTVKEASDSGYKVEWIYTNVELANNDPVLENQVVARLKNIKLLIQLSDVGRFVELLNFDEVKPAAAKAADELIAGSSDNPTMNAQYKATKQLIASKQGFEIGILKQIKFYNFSFGFNYKLGYVQSNHIKLTNPLGGPAFDAVEKVQLTKLNNKNAVCVIETNKSVDGEILKKSVVEFVRKAAKSVPAAIEELNNSKLEITESSMQQIDFARGIIQKSFFKRIMNLGFQNRTTVLEIETAE